MKPTRFSAILYLAILSSAIAIGLFASTASAQAPDSPRLRVTIPFAFQAGSKQMPAGIYDIHFKTSYLLLLQGRNAGKPVTQYLMATPTQSVERQATGRMVFHRYGDRYFLREVWEAGTREGVTCVASHEEKEILRSQNQPAGTQVQLALNSSQEE